MAKVFYTEHDIEDMVKRGVMSLEVNDSVVLTDLAYEKANRLGLRLVRSGQNPNSPPSAPVRPYIAQKETLRPSSAAGGSPSQPAAAGSAAPPAPDGKELQQRIKSAVIARLGSQVDPNLLDVIIRRVLSQTGLK